MPKLHMSRVVIFLVALLLTVFPTIVLANDGGGFEIIDNHGPGILNEQVLGQDEKEAEDLTRSVFESEDSGTAFLALSPEDQEAVLKWLTVVEETPVLGEDTTFTSVPHIIQRSSEDVVQGTEASGCWQRTSPIHGKNWAGVTLYTYSPTINWCGEGTWVTSASNWFSVWTGFGWEYQGVVSQSVQGGVGASGYQVYRQVQFGMCIGWPIPCGQHTYPQLTQFGGGNGYYGTW